MKNEKAGSSRWIGQNKEKFGEGQRGIVAQKKGKGEKNLLGEKWTCLIALLKARLTPRGRDLKEKRKTAQARGQLRWVVKVQCTYEKQGKNQ